MNSIETLATFIGWCAVINIGIILVALAFFSVAREWMVRISVKIFDVSDDEAKVTLFRVFQQYRIAVVVFNVVPYFALKLMG